MFLHIGWHDTNITDHSNWSKNYNSICEQSSVPIELSLKTRFPTDICEKWKGVQTLLFWNLRNICERWKAVCGWKLLSKYALYGYTCSNSNFPVKQTIQKTITNPCSQYDVKIVKKHLIWEISPDSIFLQTIPFHDFFLFKYLFIWVGPGVQQFLILDRIS